MPEPTDRELEELALLAALISAEQATSSASAEGGARAAERAWSRGGHPHLRAWSWRPREGGAWALQARLDLHRKTPLGNL